MYHSPNRVGVINSRRFKLAEHLARMGERRSVIGIFIDKHTVNKYTTSILERILEKLASI